MRKKTVIIIICAIILIATSYLVIMTIGDARAMGKVSPNFSFSTEKDSYIIKSSNVIAQQQGNSCSGYSAAFVLRHWGKNVFGDSLYNTISEKGEMGYVAPKGVVKLLQDNGMTAYYKIGNIHSLKNEVAKGHPVIAFIRIDTDHDWLHYVPIVGYTPDSIYLAESIDYLANRPNEKCYNRALSTSEFKSLWNTSNWIMPLYRNTYITAEPK